MRIKGETAEELAGFMDAVRPRLLPLAAPSTRCCCPATTAPASCPT
jgi:anthranilate phosphoribosyltransferase